MVFFLNHFPPSPRVFHLDRFEFFQKFTEIFASQGAPAAPAKLPPVSTTPVANSPPVSLTPAANLPPVSTTLAKMVEKFATGVADTGGKFATGVVDTGGNFAGAAGAP
jgi:hypothetical protein